MKLSTASKIIVAALLVGGTWAWSASAADANADNLWNMNCAACHGHDGKGQTMMGHRLHIKDLTDAKVQAALTDAQITKTIKDGIRKDGRPEMKAFGDKFSEAQMKALVAKVRSFKPGK